MTDFKINLKLRGKTINRQVTKDNKNFFNQNHENNNSNFTNIQSVHDKIIQDRLLKKAGVRGIGLTMAYACAGKHIHKGSCGCGK